MQLPDDALGASHQVRIQKVVGLIGPIGLEQTDYSGGQRMKLDALLSIVGRPRGQHNSARNPATSYKASTVGYRQLPPHQVARQRSLAR